jgi:hypothetical protein
MGIYYHLGHVLINEEHNIKTHTRKICWEDVGWFELALDKVQRCTFILELANLPVPQKHVRILFWISLLIAGRMTGWYHKIGVYFLPPRTFICILKFRTEFFY